MRRSHDRTQVKSNQWRGAPLTSAALVLLLAACTDKAKPDYDKGQAEEQRGENSAALASYEKAKTADPTSKAGKAAAERIAAIEALLKKQEEDKAKAAAAEAKAREDAQREGLAALKEHPEYLINPPYDFRAKFHWEERIPAYIMDPASKAACPEIANVSGDEFERREALAKAVAGCRDVNERALGLAKRCPSTIHVRIELSKFDFGRGMFELSSSSRESDPPWVSNSGRVWFKRNGGLLLAWPGAYAGKDSPTADRGLMATGCKTALNDSMPLVARLTVPIKMGETEAKAVRDKAKDADGLLMEIAFLFDGKTGKDDFPCEMTSKAALATGTVIAWRVEATHKDARETSVLDWQAVTPWKPDAACSEAQAFFDPNAARPTSTEPGASDGGTGRYQVKPCGAIVDATTKMEWFVGPDRDTPFKDASSWVASLKTCGEGWRLPTTDELSRLYEPTKKAGTGFTFEGKTFVAKLDPVFAGIGGGAWVWTSKEANSKQAVTQNLYINQPVTIGKDLSGGKVPFAARVFAVRASAGE